MLLNRLNSLGVHFTLVYKFFFVCNCRICAIGAEMNAHISRELIVLSLTDLLHRYKHVQRYLPVWKLITRIYVKYTLVLASFYDT